MRLPDGYSPCCAREADVPIIAKVTAVQRSENLHTFYGGSHLDGQKNTHQTNFPYYIIEKSPTSSAHNSVLIHPKNFKFGTETRCMV